MTTALKQLAVIHSIVDMRVAGALPHNDKTISLSIARALLVVAKYSFILSGGLARTSNICHVLFLAIPSFCCRCSRYTVCGLTKCLTVGLQPLCGLVKCLCLVGFQNACVDLHNAYFSFSAILFLFLFCFHHLVLIQ